MKSLIVLVTLLVILAGLVLSGISDTSAAVADSSIPSNEVTSSVNETANSANATMTITWTTAPLANEQFRENDLE